MNSHKDKHIRAAVDYALEHGWRLVMAGPRAHIWGRLYCSKGSRGGCAKSVFSRQECLSDTPEKYAKR